MAKSESLKEIERAEKALEAAKRKHREDFRKAVFAVYESYGLKIEIGNDDPRSALEIATLEGGTIDVVVPQ
jgi:hypothetical protein